MTIQALEMAIENLEKRVEWLELQMRLVHRTLDKIDRKTESNSEKPNNCEDCIWSVCNYNKAFEDEPTISKMEQVETMTCQECKHFHENAVMYLDQCDFCFKDCKYEPKDEPQTDCAWK